MPSKAGALFLILIVFCVSLHAQDSLHNLPPKYLDQVATKSATISQKLDRKSAKALAAAKRQEERLYKKLYRIDSVAAKNVFSNSAEKYNQLEDKLKNPGALKSYIPHLDSVSTSLQFLEKNPQIIAVKEKVKDALAKTEALKVQLQKAEGIRQFLKERQQYLRDQLGKFGLLKDLKNINKQAYYYQQQIKEYTAILKDPKKAEKKALELLSKTKLFQDFFKKNSALAALFRMPGDPNDPVYLASLQGLQTRAQVNNLIQQQITAGGPNAQQQFTQNLQAAQTQLNQLKTKILNAGGGSSDDIMPDGFKPNNQRTKSFLQRLELGTNMQTQKASSYFPVTSDIGLSVGYKITDKSVIGVGASYKLGWGRGWEHINITSQGAGLRSYIDIKIKGSFWLSGGYEQNYRSAFSDFDQLKDKNAWQQSGLIGVSKTIAVRSKLFKKTKAQLLWDFLSTQQVPRTQSIIFRIGYNFK